MGILGLSEYEYYTNSPYVNYCKEIGYYKRLDDLQHIHRFASYRLHQSLVKKPLNIDKFWQIGEKKNEFEVPTFTPETWAEMKKTHGLT